MLLGGLFLYMSYYGCDQSQAQRLLTARSDGAARRALLLNAFLRFPVVLTYCSLGLLLAGLLEVDKAFAASVSQSPPDSLVPHFILAYLPDGLRGLFLAAIFAAAMSSIDSAMNSLAAVTLEDVFGRPPATQGVWLPRTTSLLWGFFAIGTGMLFARTGSGVIVLINQVGSAIYGPVLAVFILAVVAPRVMGRQAIIGLLCGLMGNLVLAWFVPSVSWLWWNPAGFAVTAAVALATAQSPIRFPQCACSRIQSGLLIGFFLLILLVLAFAF